MSPTFVIVHGHFYQPPRENPWTGIIERQESAAPCRDWNERVTAECYRPNGKSRVLDGVGRVLEVVNNYEHFSYNFGPTLLSYLEERHPDTYRRILDADRVNIDRHGTGNAIAQAYNHMIMPLQSARDRWTQIMWGIEDFVTRFRRRPAGMWLPETAVDMPTLEDLVRAGMRFVLLAPSQAEAIRPQGDSAWQDVSAGDIPTHRSYRCETPSGDIALLFYHEGISRGVAFEHLLRNAATFADRIEAAAREGEGEDRLVLVCSDGESYGHHSPMGDMCFAYLATREAPARGLVLTSPEAYLAGQAPAWEVRIKGGEGSAWSCAHGVGRWTRDCGCSTGGPASWHQGWREPLRRGFDRLRDAIDPLFELEATKLLRDPWKARDDYVQVLLGRPVGKAKAFFDRHACADLSDDDRARVHRLMEMQRNGMYMYTSCAWFFTDLSGIETVQNLKYAHRAAQLGELLGGEPVTDGMNAELEQAKSNISALGNGLDIVRRDVLPCVLSPEKVAAHHAMLAVVEPLEPSERLHNFRVNVHQQDSSSRNGFRAYGCRLTVLADRTREGGSFEAAVILGSHLRLRAFVRGFDPSAARVTVSDMLDKVTGHGFDEACREIAGAFTQSFALSDMLLDLRRKAVGVLLGPLLDELGETFEGIFAEHEALLRALAPLGISIPAGLAGPVGYAGSRRFNRLVERSVQDGDLDRALDLARLLGTLGVQVDRAPASRRVGRRLVELLEDILEKPQIDTIGGFVRLLRSAREAQLGVDEADLQDLAGERIGAVLKELLDPQRVGGAAVDTARILAEVAGLLNLNTEELVKRLK